MTVSFTLTAMPLMVSGPDCALRAEPAGQSNTAKAMNGADLMKRWAHSRKGLPPGQGPVSNWAKSPSEYSKPTWRWTAIISQCFVPGGRILEPPPKARGNGARTVCGAPAAAARRGHAFWGSFGDFGHPHLLRLVLRTQPRSGGGSKMRPCLAMRCEPGRFAVRRGQCPCAPWCTPHRAAGLTELTGLITCRQ